MKSQSDQCVNDYISEEKDSVVSKDLIVTISRTFPTTVCGLIIINPWNGQLDELEFITDH